MLGRIIMDLPPRAGNPRNSEGTMLRRKDGAILFVYSRFSGQSHADDASADLWGMISRDEGEHFEDAGLVVDHREAGAKNVMSPSLLRMENGDAGLFYLLRASESDMRMVLRRSAGEGAAWGEPVLCMPAPGYYVVNNDRVIRLRSGRIYIPAALHRRGVCAGGRVAFDSRAEFVGFYSDDDGASWREAPGKCVLAPMGPSRTGLQEPGIAEPAPGLLWGWARTDLGRQYETFSYDDGESWTPAQPSAFTSPVSPLCVRPLPDGRLLAVYNPVPLYNGRAETVDGVWTGGRTPLCLALAPAGGRTFSPPAAVEDDPASGYCYTSIFMAKDGVILAYCAGGRADGACLNRLRIRKIAYAELEG